VAEAPEQPENIAETIEAPDIEIAGEEKEE
jgi:hypothetical protein